MNRQCLQLLTDFCARHALALPEPDAQQRYLIGFDDVEVSLFEDLGQLYALAEVAPAPADAEARAHLLERACAYLFGYLYLDECILNLYHASEEVDEQLALVTAIRDPDPARPDDFERRLEALVDRAEALAAHLAEASRPTAPDAGLSIFRP